MYLERLEIQGFKSFAQKIVLEFDRGITAIVGPNGSGKSNIADAVRWVLGEQSLKLLRGKKSQDVIFSGSGKKSRLGLAEVSIYINNKDGQASIDYSELVITRRVYQNGEGEYFINHNKARLQDILLLIAKANFGQKSYSVIGQGMVDSIVISSPQERKDFFDEAAGVKQYQIKREQASLKLSHTQENLKQAEVLIQEIEPRLKSLTRQVRRLARREEIEKELKNIQQTHYYLQWLELDRQDNLQKGIYQKQNQEKEGIEVKKELIQAEVNKIAREDSRLDLFQKYQEEYQSLQEEKNKLQQEQVVLRGKTELVHLQKGRNDLAWLEKKKIELEQEEDKKRRATEDLRLKLIREKDFLNQYLEEQKKVLFEISQIEKKLSIGFERLKHKPELDLPYFQEEIERIYQSQKKFWEDLEKMEKVENLSHFKKEVSHILKQLKTLRERIKNIQTSGNPQELVVFQKNLSSFLKTKDNLINEINERKIRIQAAEEKMNYINKEINQASEEKKKIETELKLAQTTKENPKEAKKLFEEEENLLKEKIQSLENEISNVQEKLKSFNQEEQIKKDQLLKWQKNIQEKQQQLNEIGARLNETSIELARVETKKEDLEKEIRENLPLEYLEIMRNKNISIDSETEKLSLNERIERIQRLKHQLELIGGIDPAIQEEYQTTSERYQFLTSQIDDLKEAASSLEKIIQELDEKIKKQFKEAFDKINNEFSKYFKLLFNGGKASLNLKREEAVTADEEEEGSLIEESEEVPQKPNREKKEKIVTGIEIQACPPGKKLSDLNMLSGGEKALTAIALLCAIIANNPPPFAILDEVDAALDEANSIKYAKIFENLSHKTQFVTITHNRATMHQAAILYGVTMGDDGVSKLISVKMEEVDKMRNTKLTSTKRGS